MAAVQPRKPTNDAEAICEAVTRPTMRFVPVKSAERQAALLEHKARDFLVRQQAQTVNAIRAHLPFGPRGPWLGRTPPEGFVRASPHSSPGVVVRPNGYLQTHDGAVVATGISRFAMLASEPASAAFCIT